MPAKKPRRAHRRQSRRPLWLERLEDRSLLTAPGTLYPNPVVAWSSPDPIPNPGAG